MDESGTIEKGRIVQWELMKLLHTHGRPMRPQEVYDALAREMSLSAEELGRSRATRDESKWHNECQTAREALCKQGFMDREPFDSWALTAAGDRRLGLTLEDMGF